jgi:hypothetical protein
MHSIWKFLCFNYRILIYMNILGLCLMGDVTYCGCRVETIFIFLLSLLSTFVSILISTELLISCMDKYSVLCVWYTIFLFHLLWDWGIIEISKFRSWYKATECGQLSVCMNVSKGAPSTVSRNAPYRVPISIFLYIFDEGVIYFIFGKCTVVITLIALRNCFIYVTYL